MTVTVRIPLLIFETGLQIGIDIVQFQKVRTTAVISRIVLHDRMPEKGTLLTFGQIGGVFLVQHFKSFVSMCVSTMTSEKFPTWIELSTCHVPLDVLHSLFTIKSTVPVVAFAGVAVTLSSSTYCLLALW